MNQVVLRHLVAKFGHLLKMPSYFTTPSRLRAYADALWAKGCRFSNCIGFIDGTLRRTTRPKLMQRSVYNGHKKYHGQKYQNVTFPDGMIVDQHGPYAGRRSDPYMMVHSGICHRLHTRCRFPLNTPERIAEHTPADPAAPTFFSPMEGPPTHIQYMLFGDKGYHTQDSGCIQVPFKRYAGYELLDDEKSFNKDMAAVRVTAEWGFCRVLQLWGYLDHYKQMKWFQTPLAHYYIAATLLSNIHNCIHPNAASRKYNVAPPTLEEYLAFPVPAV